MPLNATEQDADFGARSALLQVTLVCRGLLNSGFADGMNENQTVIFDRQVGDPADRINYGFPNATHLRMTKICEPPKIQNRG